MYIQLLGWPVMSRKSPYIKSVHRTAGLRGYCIHTEKKTFIGLGFTSVFIILITGIRRKWIKMRLFSF